MKAGYIYLIHNVGTDRYKIGLTVAPKTLKDGLKELNSLQNPYPLKLVHYVFVNDVYTLQKRLHKACSKYRAYREWFQFSLNQRNKVILMMNSLATKTKSPQPTKTGFDCFRLFRLGAIALLVIWFFNNTSKLVDFGYCIQYGGGVACSRIFEP